MTAYYRGRVGDLAVAERPDDRMALALQVIASELHQGFDTISGIVPGKSKESCILMAVTVREFLYKIGFRDATIHPVVFFIDAMKGEECVKQLGIGNPEGPDPKITDAFDGHMIVKTDGWLIDPTLYHATPRPEWPDFPPMMATPLFPHDWDVEWFGLKALAGGVVEENDQGLNVRWCWLDQPDNDGWKKAGDYVKKFKRERVVQHMVEVWRKAVKEVTA